MAGIKPIKPTEIKPIRYRVAVQIDPEHIIAKWERYYLIPIFRGQLTEKIDVRDLGLATFVAEQVNAFLKEDKLPAKEIQGPILNIAEDFIAGRPLIFRAGDYIALQNYRRETGKIK